MEIGIVKGKYSKPIRWVFYICIPVLLIITYPILEPLDLGISTTWLIFGILCISGFIIIHNIADKVDHIGTVELLNDSFNFKVDNTLKSIPFVEIQSIILQPMLGVSRLPQTFKVYKCNIQTTTGKYTYQITREEVKNGKLKPKNLLNPKAFDFIKFLDSHSINYKYGKRIN